MISMSSSDCTAELVKDFATYNDIPYCGGEAAARVLFISNLVDDLEPGTVSTEDTTASWAEITGGLYPPGSYQRHWMFTNILLFLIFRSRAESAEDKRKENDSFCAG